NGFPVETTHRMGSADVVVVGPKHGATVRDELVERSVVHLHVERLRGERCRQVAHDVAGLHERGVRDAHRDRIDHAVRFACVHQGGLVEHALLHLHDQGSTTHVPGHGEDDVRIVPGEDVLGPTAVHARGLVMNLRDDVEHLVVHGQVALEHAHLAYRDLRVV